MERICDTIEMEKVGIVVVFVLCAAWQVQAQAVNCTANGRYAATNDPTCQNYTLCVYIPANNSFVSYNYVCPTTSVFNPNSGLCTDPTSYICPANSTNTTTPNPPTPCTAAGYIPDPSVTNCSSYITCADLGNGSFAQTTLTCPASTFYNPNTTFCDSTYNCTTPFTCTQQGRFADTTDTTCQAYYFCVLAANGTYLQYNYTCPSTSVFNPAAGLCTSSYTCPTTT